MIRAALLSTLILIATVDDRNPASPCVNTSLYHRVVSSHAAPRLFCVHAIWV